LTKELNSLILEKIDSQVKNLNSLILEEINSLAKARYCQIITKLLTREELNSPILKEKIKALKNKELDSLMKKRKSWIRELNSQTEKINLWIKKQKKYKWRKYVRA